MLSLLKTLKMLLHILFLETEHAKKNYFMVDKNRKLVFEYYLFLETV